MEVVYKNTQLHVEEEEEEETSDAERKGLTFQWNYPDGWSGRRRNTI